MMGHVDNAEAIPHVAGESVTTTRGASGPNWDNLQQDYERLGSFKAVATEYGVAPETVSRKAKELGVRSQRRARQDVDRDEVRRLYEAGATAAELATHFKSSLSTVYMWLWASGVEMRPSGPRDFTWGPEQYAKREAAVERGAYKGAQRERFKRLGQQSPKMNSPQERLIQQALLRARLSFETQCRILRFYPDVKLHQQPILIEVDSWGHQMPTAREFDQRRDALLAAAGFTVVRFTNEQAEADADLCVRKVMDTFGLVPEENPVAIIRSRRGEPGSVFTPDEDIV
jgi:very-short-patch-repair endonuclease